VSDRVGGDVGGDGPAVVDPGGGLLAEVVVVGQLAEAFRLGDQPQVERGVDVLGSERVADAGGVTAERVDSLREDGVAVEQRRPRVEVRLAEAQVAALPEQSGVEAAQARIARC